MAHIKNSYLSRWLELLAKASVVADKCWKYALFMGSVLAGEVLGGDPCRPILLLADGCRWPFWSSTAARSGDGGSITGSRFLK